MNDISQADAPPLDTLLAAARPLRDGLASHPVYARIDSPAALRTFMEHHAFAVWDFMTLLKALQRELTCVDLPWVPRGDGATRRLINAIVLDEESDDDGAGGHASHFEIYLDAMRNAGADTRPIERLLDELGQGTPLPEALDRSGAPGPSRAFVLNTWRVATAGSLPAVAAAFALGREDVIPEMFRAVVVRLDAQDGGRLAGFRRYLERHIELDGDEHSGLALRMVASTCGDDPARWSAAQAAAIAALEARHALWDGVVARLDSDQPTGR